MVGASALGITLGPGISSFLEFIPSGKIGATYVESFNIFSFVFFFLWICVLIAFILVFQGHDKQKGSEEKLKQIEYEEYVYD